MAKKEASMEERFSGHYAVPVALVVPLVLALAVGGFVLLTDNGALPVARFYELSAAIIPILLIAFALERRATEFFSDPQIRLYRLQLFLFLLGGEICALLGASGALRGNASLREFAEGSVAGEQWSNAIAAGTALGLVGGFAMLAVLALSGHGWLLLSFRPGPEAKRSEDNS